MSGTVKLIGSADQHWDDTLENADHSIETRLIGKEDIYWDSEGTDEQGSFVDRTGTDRPITLINASHIPLPLAAREAISGAENVSEGMIKLSQMAGTGGGSGAMTEDKTVVLAASLTHIQKQALINSQTKNLGGHTLTLSFPEAIDISFSDCLKFFGFYNGYLVIDLNSITISDNINITKLFYIYDCSCKVEVKDGTLQHTVSQYAIYAERCPGVYLTDMIFIGAGGTTNYAFGGMDCDGYASGCTYSNDNQVALSGFGSDDASGKASSEASSAVSTHNASGSAHASLFAGKANASHTHTPAQAGADAAGTAATAVSTHNSASTAHSGVLAPLASPTFTGTPTAPTPTQGDNSTRVATTAFVATAIDATPGIIDRDVARHNASATAHSGILAPLASPVFTGTPEVPTAVNGTSSNQAASTKFVQNAIESTSKIGEVADAKVSTHNTSSAAHQTLFNSKAAANHTHTPQAVGADPSGSASSAVSTHNSANDAHASLFDGKANAGTIFPFAGNGTVPSLFILCDGRAVSRTTYSRLFAVIGTLYGAGDGSTTFNVPDFRGAFLRGYLSGTSAAIGAKQAEGLPDIKGTLPGEKISTDSSLVKYWQNVTGAFQKPSTTTNDKTGNSGTDGTNNNIEFAASNSNSIYGASDHVTPVNFAVQYIIKY